MWSYRCYRVTYLVIFCNRPLHDTRGTCQTNYACKCLIEYYSTSSNRGKLFVFRIGRSIVICLFCWLFFIHKQLHVYCKMTGKKIWPKIGNIFHSFHSLLKCHTSFDDTNIYQSCKIFQNTLKQMTSSHIWLMRHYYITLNNIQLYNYTTCDVGKVLKIVEEYMWRSVYVCLKGLNSVLMNWVQWFVAIVYVCDWLECNLNVHWCVVRVRLVVWCVAVVCEFDLCLCIWLWYASMICYMVCGCSVR